jgi:Integrase zinc binding domain
MFNAHEGLLHRGTEPVYHLLKREFYWPGMKETIANVTKKCGICAENNRKKTGGSDFVTTERPLQKMALDIAKVDGDARKILVAIDYYTRYLRMKVIEDRRSGTIITAFSSMFEGIGYPEYR